MCCFSVLILIFILLDFIFEMWILSTQLFDILLLLFTEKENKCQSNIVVEGKCCRQIRRNSIFLPPPPAAALMLLLLLLWFEYALLMFFLSSHCLLFSLSFLCANSLVRREHAQTLSLHKHTSTLTERKVIVKCNHGFQRVMCLILMNRTHGQQVQLQF